MSKIKFFKTTYYLKSKIKQQITYIITRDIKIMFIRKF